MKIQLVLLVLLCIQFTSCSEKIAGFEVSKKVEISKNSKGESWCLPMDKATLIWLANNQFIILQTPDGQIYSCNGASKSALNYPPAENIIIGDNNCLADYWSKQP